MCKALFRVIMCVSPSHKDDSIIETALNRKGITDI